MIVVGLARRPKLIEELRHQLPEPLRPNLHARKCDVSVEAEIVETFAKIERELGGVDVLINNAGIFYQGDLTAPGNSELVNDVVSINLLAPVFCTREAIQSMKKRGDCGYIVHINSIAGHSVPAPTPDVPSYNMYAPSKYAVTAMTEVMRQELVRTKSKIKVTVRMKMS
jgi:NADP+-dependent farnesol dehydrogenase